jgi:hypothetical protein
MVTRPVCAQEALNLPKLNQDGASKVSEKIQDPPMDG